MATTIIGLADHLAEAAPGAGFHDSGGEVWGVLHPSGDTVSFVAMPDQVGSK
jgi:hypothetical protein